jgi:predicted transcriptional regulator
MSRYDTLEALEKRRAAWAKEIERGGAWAEAGRRIVGELDKEIAERKGKP